MLKNVVFLIPARRNSKGFKFKNRELIDFTLNSIPKEYLSKVYISTDDEELKIKSKKVNINIIDRPVELAQDKTTMKDVLQHFIDVENITNKKFKVIDARSKRRFEGKDPEPRKDVRSGSIKNSYCLPFNELITENHTFKNSKDILNKFSSLLGSTYDEEIVFSCGSGVTAAVLALAYSMINNKYTPTIYDGSWAEYGKLKL